MYYILFTFFCMLQNCNIRVFKITFQDLFKPTVIEQCHLKNVQLFKCPMLWDANLYSVTFIDRKPHVTVP
jgi:hypothetical protein